MNVPRVTEISGSQWHPIVNGATETAIISTDQQGNVTSWNTGASRLLGWTEEEMLGQSLSRIFGEEEPGARLNREIDDAVRHGRGGGEEGWRLRKDGSRFWAVGELSPIRDGTKIVGFIKILRDRTAQREAEQEIHEERRALEILNRAGSVLAVETVTERTEQLRRNEDALRQSQKMEAIGQLTGGVAHDFNNLLQVIIGNIETLQRNLPTESARLQRVARNAMTGAQRAASLTQRLLAFSRRQPLDPKPIDANVLVNGMSEMIHRTLGETISVETVLGAGLWRAEADPNELEASILNLAVNARDAMPNGGRWRRARRWTNIPLSCVRRTARLKMCLLPLACNFAKANSSTPDASPLT